MSPEAVAPAALAAVSARCPSRACSGQGSACGTAVRPNTGPAEVQRILDRDACSTSPGVDRWCYVGGIGSVRGRLAGKMSALRPGTWMDHTADMDRGCQQVRLVKIKRPGGAYCYCLRRWSDDEHGTWLFGPAGSRWSAPHDDGVLPVDVLVLIAQDRPFVAWWVADPDDMRIELDVCLPPIPQPSADLRRRGRVRGSPPCQFYPSARRATFRPSAS